MIFKVIFDCFWTKLNLKVLVCSLLLTILFSPIFSQTQSVESSLEVILESADDDSIKISALRELGESAENPQDAVAYLTEALKLSEEAGFKNMTANVSTSLGIVYYNLGNYEKTLEYFYKAQSIYETEQDTPALARSYNNIGLILIDLGRASETIEYYTKSLRIKEKLNDSIGIANTYSNLGLAYQEIDSLDLAMRYFRKALKLDKILNQHFGQFTSLSNIGSNYFKKGNYDSSEVYYQQAVMLLDLIDSKFNKAELLRDYGKLNAANGEYERAIEKYQASLMLAEEINALLIVRDNYEELSKVHTKLEDYEASIRYFEKYDSIKEQIFSQDQSKKIAEIETDYHVQKKQKEIELLKKESEIKDLRLSNNQYIMYFLIVCLLLVFLLVFLQYRKNIYKSRTNLLLRAQNEQIVEKNKNIMDSIMYAKNIQKAILPPGKKLKEMLRDSFVYSKARDVVNGDFYWFAEKGDKIVIAAVDCTGHGVPAAFLNVIGNSHLNHIVYEQDILNPAEILNQLNKRILGSLYSNNLSIQGDDGMDIGICLFDRSTKNLCFAGAKRPLYYFHNHELNILKGDRFPVGGETYKEDREFSEHNLELQPNDCVYMFTDGLVDQFGGTENKKYMYPRLRNLLMQIHEAPMEEQLNRIKQELQDWQGHNEQTDDILIIGFKV